MADIAKSECITAEEAIKELNVSRATLYNYMNVLGMKREKFIMDRRAYVRKTDMDRLKTFKAGLQG